MAVKIVRQPNKIVLIGVPSSAGSHGAGTEKAPAALRAAGLVDRLRQAGFDVTDAGDCPVQEYKPDDESPRARNLRGVLATLGALRPQVEVAVKSGALPLILGGDCSIALGTLAGVRRYFHHLSLMYCDRDADLNTPATTPSGCIHGMGLAHIIGQGASELVRFFTDPPLVRQPDIALFGLERLDPPEEQFLSASPMRRYSVADIRSKRAAAAASEAVERIHSGMKQLVLHFDVDVLTAEELPAAEFAAPGGLRSEEMRAALDVFVRQPNLAAIEVTEYVPDKDPDGSSARLVVDLLATALAARLVALTQPPAEEKPKAAAATAESSAAPPAPSVEPQPEPAVSEPAPETTTSDATAEPGSTEPEPST